MAHLRRLVEPMYLAFMQATHADLATQIEYLRAENRILRKKLGTKLKVTKAERQGLGTPGIVIHDNDTKLCGGFDAALRAVGWRPKRIRVRAPKLNGYAERWVGSVKRECLDHFVCFGKGHLDHLVTEYLEHYHGERPHLGLGNVRPMETWPPRVAGEVVCKQRLGGVLRRYERAA